MIRSPELGLIGMHLQASARCALIGLLTPHFYPLTPRLTPAFKPEEAVSVPKVFEPGVHVGVPPLRMNSSQFLFGNGRNGELNVQVNLCFSSLLMYLLRGALNTSGRRCWVTPPVRVSNEAETAPERLGDALRAKHAGNGEDLPTGSGAVRHNRALAFTRKRFRLEGAGMKGKTNQQP